MEMMIFHLTLPLNRLACRSSTYAQNKRLSYIRLSAVSDRKSDHSLISNPSFSKIVLQASTFVPSKLRKFPPCSVLTRSCRSTVSVIANSDNRQELLIFHPGESPAKQPLTPRLTGIGFGNVTLVIQKPKKPKPLDGCCSQPSLPFPCYACLPLIPCNFSMNPNP